MTIWQVFGLFHIGGQNCICTRHETGLKSSPDVRFSSCF